MDQEAIVATAKMAMKLSTQAVLERKLAASKLPAPAQQLVRGWTMGHLERDRPVCPTDIDEDIRSVREAFAAMSPIGRVRENYCTTGMDTSDKIQAAMDRMLGVKEAMKSGIKPFRGIQDAYVFITGDRDLEFGHRGRGGFAKVAEATVTTSDFPNILLNSMNKKLLQDYNEIGLGGLDQVVTMTDIADYKTQDRVRLGYLSDLSTVAEDAAYTDFAKPTDEKIQYTAAKRGNTMSISRETILNDDLNKVAQFPGRIARAARRTMKQFITNLFVNNPNYDPDSVAVFHATHGNLSSLDLTVDELIQREIALALQTEKDSGKPLGLTLDWIMVPSHLRATAWKINVAETYGVGPGIVEPNPFYRRFGQNGERIIVNELLDASDANDWYYGTLPINAPILEVGFVQGIREPQIFLQNDPTTGSVFTNDRITYKVRFEFGGDWLDFRGVGKASVA